MSPLVRSRPHSFYSGMEGSVDYAEMMYVPPARWANTSGINCGCKRSSYSTFLLCLTTRPPTHNATHTPLLTLPLLLQACTQAGSQTAAAVALCVQWH